ncbi:MAG: substrate-binding domain-containing protein [Anaerolineales bacterium]|nr:substrate-binding domain-containing protein [Anaerolineales bacterium]
MNSNDKRNPAQPTDRPTIGVLVDSLASGYQIELWRGLKQAAERQDVNLLCFVGREIDSPVENFSQANAIYKLATSQSVDGLIFLTGTLSHYVSLERTQAFVDQFGNLPVVSVAVSMPEMASVILDNYSGSRAVVEHLIKDHGYERIAYARMRSGHAEGDERFRAYREALADHGIAFNPKLVVPGEYYYQAEAAVSLLYDQNQANPQAIVVVDDDMALQMQEVLQARGLRIPEDVAMVGFDDIEASRFATPALTTLRQPLAEQAQHALDLVLAQISGQSVPEQILLEPEMILRQSCGCLPASLLRAATPVALPTGLPADQDWEARRSALLEGLQANNAGLTPAQLSSLLDAFWEALQTQDTNAFIWRLTQIVPNTGAQSRDLSVWQETFTTLRAALLPGLSDPANRAQAENLIQLARFVLAEQIQRRQANNRLQAQRQETALRILGQALNDATDTGALLNLLAGQLPGLDIPAAQIVLYLNRDPSNAQARLMLSYQAGERLELPNAGLLFQKDLCLPEQALPAAQRFSRVVEPLFFGTTQLGYGIFEATNEDESLYDTLAELISGAFRSMLLVQQVARRAVQLQTAAEVSEVTISILEPALLLQQAVDLVRERFDLYYAGIFLKDEFSRYAVLKAATGEPGQQMLAEGWRLEIGGGSMIGRCISEGKADIQLDVDQAPVHLRNPHLPETRSEMALPLTSRGEVLGALTIQSTAPQAFSSEDITVLQTMASQIATALTNANLLEQTQRTIRELEETQRRYEIQAWTEYTRQRETIGYQKSGEEIQPLAANLPEVSAALQANQPIIQKNGQESNLLVPVLLRGQPIGVLGIKSDLQRPDWSEEEITLVQAIVEQFALAAESLRLLDETQRRAARERLVAEITTRLRATNDPQTMLQTAVVELQKALKVQRAQVIIQPEASQGASNPDNSGQSR